MSEMRQKKKIKKVKDREIVCFVCKKRMKIGSGLSSMLKDYSHCAECLNEEYNSDKKKI